jgi:hypothetical protein
MAVCGESKYVLQKLSAWIKSLGGSFVEQMRTFDLIQNLSFVLLVKQAATLFLNFSARLDSKKLSVGGKLTLALLTTSY